MKPVKLGEITIPVNFDNAIDLVNLQRKIRRQLLLPEDMTKDNMRISFNSEKYREDLINISFLEHLKYDILIPYPSNAWMGSILPDGVFTEIHSINYYQKINGDCELTHAIEDLHRILKHNGTVHIGVPNFKLILEKIVEMPSEVTRLQWEHFLFSRNVDERGLFYNQSICDVKRIVSRARHAGFRDIQEDLLYGKENEKYIEMHPENFDLPGVNEQARIDFNIMLKDSKIRRKKCIMTRCTSKAGQQEYKRQQSVYCRRHYRKAKQKLQEMQECALRSMVVLKKE